MSLRLRSYSALRMLNASGLKGLEDFRWGSAGGGK